VSVSDEEVLDAVLGRADFLHDQKLMEPVGDPEASRRQQPKLVFAIATGIVTMPGGWTMLINQGGHWLADDPTVLRRPDLFSDDYHVGLQQTPGRVETDPNVEQLRVDA
jgi:hypothetical protein